MSTEQIFLSKMEHKKPHKRADFSVGSTRDSGVVCITTGSHHRSKGLELRKNRMRSRNTEEFNLIRLYV